MRRTASGLILVDYLQLMRTDSRYDSRVTAVGELSRGLKILARELEVPVIAISQLSRAVEQRPDKKKIPQLSDLRESGNLEQDADLVDFIYRDEYYNEETERPGEADLIIAKHRNGAGRQGHADLPPGVPEVHELRERSATAPRPPHRRRRRDRRPTSLARGARGDRRASARVRRRRSSRF